MTQIPDGIQLTPFDSEFYQDPYAVLKRLRDVEPIHQDGMSFYENSWTITEYESVKQLLSDPRLSVNPESIGLRRDPRADNPVTLRDPDMMNLDEPDHSRLRKLVHRAFTPSSINEFAERIRTIVNTCMAEIQSDEFDVVSHLAKPIPTIVIAEYIGIDSSNHLQFKAWTDSLLKQGYPIPTEEQWDEIVDAHIALRSHMQEIIEARRAQIGDDLISRLILAQEADDSLSDTEIIDMCALLIGAGNFTTTDLISNGIHALLSNDNASATAAQIVEETLRFDPPSMAVRRYVTEDIEVKAQTIKQGSVVSLHIGAANHDPSTFDDPDEFSAVRDHQVHLAFGRGIHHCLGAPLARLEATITLECFMAQYPDAIIQSTKRRKRMDFRGFDNLIVRT